MREWDFDLNLFRTSLEADSFNIFNQAHVGDPNTTLGNEAFGTIGGNRLPGG